VHVFDWPQDGLIQVSGVGKVVGAYLLGDASHKALSLRVEQAKAIVSGPAQAPDAIDTVVVLTTEP